MRINLGQWLRWEAALEEIGAYYRVPGEFRLEALTSFGKTVEQLVGSSRSLLLLPPQQRPEDKTADDEELALRTIFPFVVRRGNRILSLDDCKTLYRELARDMSSDDPGTETKPCLIGQPVALGRDQKHLTAALRISASARLVSEAFSSDEDLARSNLRRVLDDVGAVVAKIERLASEMEGLETRGDAYEARA